VPEYPSKPRGRIVRAAATYFALVFGTGFVLGTVRVPFLVPRYGVRTAELLEMSLMLVAIVISARFVVRRFELASAGGRAALAVGGLALACLIVAELGVAWALGATDPAAYLASRDPVSGTVYAIMLLVYASMPAVIAHRQRGLR
jgi:hypothetical protein